MLAVIMYS